MTIPLISSTFSLFPFQAERRLDAGDAQHCSFHQCPFAKSKCDLTPAGETYFHGWREKYTFGNSDVNPTGFFVPTLGGAFAFGFGPTLSILSDKIPLSTGKWTAGRALVSVYMKGPWVVGGLVNNMLSFAGDNERKDVNKMLTQRFVN